MNQEELKRMLNAVYELEGLLEMALRRDLSESHAIYQLITDKSYTIANMAAEWNLSEYTQSYSERFDTEDEKVIDVFVDNCLAKEEKKVEDKIENYTDDIDIVEESADSDLVDSIIDEPEVVVECEKEIMADDYEDVDDIKDASGFEDGQIEESDEIYDDDTIQDDEELGEFDDLETKQVEFKSERKDIRTFFTINDKFRFKRELFGNNNLEFTESLNLVQTMNSYEEAEDYFYNDLQWDSGSEDVMEFMAIIERSFK